MILAKRFSIWCRHFYISRSCSRGAVRLRFRGITGTAPHLVADRGSERKVIQKIRHARKVVCLAGKDHEPHKVTERVHDGHDLAGQPTPGTADPLAAGPPFAPAAFW